MKKTLRCLSFALCAVMLLCAAACGEEQTPAAWRTDVTAQQVSDAVLSKTSAAELLGEQDQTVIELEMDLDLALCTDFAMYMTDSTLDEFGVFCAKDEAGAATVETAVKNYIKRRNDEWTGLYNVDEYPKLEKATTIRCGRYVVYTVLTEAERTAAFDAVKQLLKG